MLKHSIALGLLTILCALFLGSAPLRTNETLQLGTTDQLTVAGFDTARTNDEGRGFRWTEGNGRIQLHRQGMGQHRLAFTISAPQPPQERVPVTVALNGQPLLTFAQSATPRRYTLLVSPQNIHWRDNMLQITSPTFQPNPQDQTRQYGVIVFDAGWSVVDDQRWLVPVQIATILLATALLLFLLKSADIPFFAQIMLILLFFAITLTMRHSDQRFIYRIQAVILTSMLGCFFLIAGMLLRRATDTHVLFAFRQWMRQHSAALLGYILLTALMQLPLITHFSTHIFGVAGDSYEFLWKLQWFNDSVLQQHVSPVFAPQIFVPTGFDLSHTDLSPAQTLLTLPVTHLFGPIVSYNTAIITSYVLSGFFTYLLAHRLGANRAGAWVAGLLFAFCMRRVYHQYAGHLNLTATQWIPLAIYGWEGVITRRRAWDGYVTGLGLGLSAWASWYYGPTLAGLLALYLLLRPGRELGQLGQSWRAVLLAGSVALALVAPLAQPYVEAQQRGETLAHDLSELELYSAQPLDFFMPNMEHPLWGAWARQLNRDPRNEHLVALGYTLITLSVAGVWFGRKHGAVVVTLLIILFVNIIMTLGPTLLLANGNALPLPARFVHDYVPVLSGIRSWSRMSIYITLCAALLASLVLTAVVRRWQPIALLCTTGLILAEYAATSPLHAPLPRPVDLWLREQPGNGAVIQMPKPPDGTSEYYSLFTHKPTISWHGAFEPLLVQENKGTFDFFPKENVIKLLQRWQTTYIIIDEAALKQRQAAWKMLITRSPSLKRVYQDQVYSVYQMRNAATR